MKTRTHFLKHYGITIGVVGIVSILSAVSIWKLYRIDAIPENAPQAAVIIFQFFAFIIVLLPLIYREPTQEEYAAKVASHENYFRELWSNCSHLDEITGVDFPDYTVDSVECSYVTFPPTDYEYNVELTLVFSKPVPRSICKDIYTPRREGSWPEDEGTSLVMNARRDTMFVTEWHY